MTSTTPTPAATIQRAEAALAERARLAAFAADLPARITAAEAAKAEALAAQAAADTAAMIGEPSAQAGWRKAADAEAAKVAAADRQIARLIAARDGLPVLIVPADDEILDAHESLQAEIAEAARITHESLAVKIRDVAAQLGLLLQQGHALAAAGVSSNGFLVGVKVTNPVGRDFIAGHGMTLDTETVPLDRTWRSDPSAVAVFDAHMPYTAMAQKIGREVRRIHDARSRARDEENKAARARSFADPRPQHAPPRAPYEPPKSTFTPNADTHNPPPPSTVRDGTLRFDIPVDRTESLSPAEMDTLWAQSSGGLTRPANDAEFNSIAARLPPWRVQGLIERQGRLAAAKARHDADPKARMQQPLQSDAVATAESPA